MKNNKGFTLIELLAVILILGIIALIAIPTVNNILKESRTGAWKSTASQMTKSAENYYQLQIIKNAPYIADFRTAESSNTGKYFDLDTDGKTLIEVDTQPSNVENVMAAALALKGDIPSISDLKVFTINSEGQVTLAFDNTSVYCMTISSSTFSPEDYSASTNGTGSGTELLTADGNVECIGK